LKIIRPLSKYKDSIVADFIGTYNRTAESVIRAFRTESGRILYLRPSQLPFCPLSFFINHATRGMFQTMDFGSSLYVNIGTAVHTVLQSYLSQSERFLADYHCLECGKWYRMSRRIECCDFPTQYHEIEIDYKGIKGHIDAIYVDRKGQLWILDFKTASIASAESKKKNPGIVYREQIETYGVLFELQYRKKIEGIMNAFILRDNPLKSPAIWHLNLTNEIRETVKKRLTGYKKMHRAALDCTSRQEALSLLKFGHCENPDCDVCKKTDSEIKQLLRNAQETGTQKNRLPIRKMAEGKKQKN